MPASTLVKWLPRLQKGAWLNILKKLENRRVYVIAPDGVQSEVDANDDAQLVDAASRLQQGLVYTGGPQRKCITVSIPQITYHPPHVGGDTDFDGNGPAFAVLVQLLNTPPTITLRIEATFTETKSDYTRFAGVFDTPVYNVGQANPGYEIETIDGGAWASFVGVDQNHAPETMVPTGGTLVNSATIVGDSNGGIFGGDDRPSVTLNFHPVTVCLRQI